MSPYVLPARTGSRAIAGAGAALIGVLWLSQAIFAAYILAHYGGALLDRTPERWNDSLPRLHEPGQAWQMVGIGLHFLAGAVLIVLVPLQLAGPLRRRFPAVHR